MPKTIIDKESENAKHDKLMQDKKKNKVVAADVRSAKTKEISVRNYFLVCNVKSVRPLLKMYI